MFGAEFVRGRVCQGPRYPGIPHTKARLIWGPSLLGAEFVRGRVCQGPSL